MTNIDIIKMKSHLSSNYLLPVGVHNMSLLAIYRVFVKSFPNSTKRQFIFKGFLQYLRFLKKIGLNNFTIYLDGSFFTAKNEPSDIDFVMKVDYTHFRHHASLQKLQYTAKQELHCDSYFYFDFPKDMEQYLTQTVHFDNYWFKQWGHERSGDEKGFISFIVNFTGISI